MFFEDRCFLVRTNLVKKHVKNMFQHHFALEYFENQGGEVVDFMPTCAASDRPLNTTPGRDVNFLQSPVG